MARRHLPDRKVSPMAVSRRFAAIALAGTVCLSIGAARPAADEVPADEQGFVPLFDGKTLDGWEGDEKLFKAEGGAIVGDSPGIRRNEFLSTKKRYGDFELRLEFKLHKGQGNT